MHYPKLIRPIIVTRKLFLIKIISTNLLFSICRIFISKFPSLENLHPTKLLNLEYLSFPFRIRFIKVRRCSWRFVHHICEKIPRENSIDGRFADKKRGKARIHQIYFTKEQVDLRQRVISILALN